MAYELENTHTHTHIHTHTHTHTYTHTRYKTQLQHERKIVEYRQGSPKIVKDAKDSPDSRDKKIWVESRHLKDGQGWQTDLGAAEHLVGVDAAQPVRAEHNGVLRLCFVVRGDAGVHLHLAVLWHSGIGITITGGVAASPQVRNRVRYQNTVS